MACRSRSETRYGHVSALGSSLRALRSSSSASARICSNSARAGAESGTTIAALRSSWWRPASSRLGPASRSPATCGQRLALARAGQQQQSHGIGAGPLRVCSQRVRQTRDLCASQVSRAPFLGRAFHTPGRVVGAQLPFTAKDSIFDTTATARFAAYGAVAAILRCIASMS